MSDKGLRAGLDKAPKDVAAMFDRVAKRYDITNDVLALGQTRLWRKAVVAALKIESGHRVLDLAAGTGTSSEPMRQAGAQVLACDFSLGMLQTGHERLPHIDFVAGDGTALPLADDTFDAVSISFGLRNIVDPDRGLHELLRVTKPGGRLVLCEFSHPTNALFRKIYLEYLMKALPAMAKVVSSNPDAYVYLADSIRAWPDQAALSQRIVAAGWTHVGWRDMTGGIVALHRGVKPGRSVTSA